MKNKRWIVLLISALLAVALPCHAGTMMLGAPYFHQVDDDNDLLSGGLLYTYEPGTTTPKATYSDYDLSTPNTNPVVLDSRGEATVYLDGEYKLVLYSDTDGDSSPDDLIWTEDHVNYDYAEESYTDYVVDTLADLQAYTGSSTTIYVNGRTSTRDGFQGRFSYVSGDYSTEVAADTTHAIYVQKSGVPTTTGAWIRTVTFMGVYLKWFSPNADDTNDDAALIEVANDFSRDFNVPLMIEEGQYYIANPGITINDNYTHIIGLGNVELRCERTYYVDQGGGVYTIGQGNIFNADTITGITLENITLVGAYNTLWGDQNPGDNSVTAGNGSALLFILDSTDIMLDRVVVKESYSSDVTVSVSQENQLGIVYGSNEVKISGCENVIIRDCSWIDSAGEGWLVYDSDKVTVDNFTGDSDYVVSQLDVVGCTNSKIHNSKFLRRSQTDAGDLLNTTLQDSSITGNTFLNGNCDVGNEYLNRNITLLKTFPVKNVAVSSNTMYNGYFTVSTQADTFNSTWAHENISFSGNTVHIDLDTRYAADGFTPLNYTAFYLPYAHDSRDISVNGNTITLTGTLQGNPANDRLRLIDGIQESTGYTSTGYSITGNVATCSVTSYDPDDLNNVSGFIVLENGTYDNLTVDGNTYKGPACFMILRDHDSSDIVSIRNNTSYSEGFFNVPYTETNTDMDTIDISNNTFTFWDQTGHTYDATDLETKGAGRFVNIVPYTTADIVDLTIDNNKVKAPGFVYVTNFQSCDTVEVDADINKNKVHFIDYTNLDGAASEYPVRIGRTNTDNDRSVVRMADNLFTENTTSDVDFTIQEWYKLYLLRNEFYGDFDLTVSCDDLSGVASSVVVANDTISIGTFTLTSANIDTVVTKLDLRNTTATGIGAAITGNLATD